MMKTCLITYKFFYDSELKSRCSHTALCEDTEFINRTLEGHDFNTLWELLEEINFRNICLCTTKKGRIIDDANHFFGQIFEKKNNCKYWAIQISTQEKSVSMRELMDFDSEKVIKYFKDRNIFIPEEMKKS